MQKVGVFSVFCFDFNWLCVDYFDNDGLCYHISILMYFGFGIEYMVLLIVLCSIGSGFGGEVIFLRKY